MSDEVGVAGGAAKATLLLCELLAGNGSRVDLFCGSVPEDAAHERLAAASVEFHGPFIRAGSRFRLPHRSAGIRAWLKMRTSPHAVMHAVGMQREVRQYLSLPGRFRTFVWETTEALPQNRFIAPGMARLLGKAEALLVPSRAVEMNARSTYGFGGSTSILPFWVEDRGKGVVSVDRGKPRRFLFVGRMDPDKGFRFLVPAFEHARAVNGDICLDICGSGDPRGIPELSALRPGITARGSIDDSELDARFAECFAVVLPSLHEGYPLTLLEACSYGKPVIATAVGSIPEVFNGRDCAILVPPGDTAALEGAMLDLLTESPADYARRSADSRRLFEELTFRPAIIGALSRAYGTSTARVPAS